MEEEILGQKNNVSHKGGGIRPGQEPLCMFVCVRDCVLLRMKTEVENSMQKDIALGYII